MKVENKTCNTLTSEISDVITKIFESVPAPKGESSPAVMVIKYFKDEKTGKLLPHFLIGALEYPVVLFDECDEGDNMLYLKTAKNYFIYRIPGKKSEHIQGSIFIPKTAKIVDYNNRYQNHLNNIENENIPQTENLVEIIVFSDYRK